MKSDQLSQDLFIDAWSITRYSRQKLNNKKNNKMMEWQEFLNDRISLYVS